VGAVHHDCLRRWLVEVRPRIHTSFILAEFDLILSLASRTFLCGFHSLFWQKKCFNQSQRKVGWIYAPFLIPN
jgi:hypothetical protein